MRKFKILFLILIIILGGFLFFGDDLADFYQRLYFQLPEIKKEVSGLVKEAEQKISTPPPLRAEKEVLESFLTRAGVIEWTNVQRENYDLPPLKESPELMASALIKTEDMCAKQYFAHDSPLGEGVADLAEISGYEFIAIGENLAMGNFENDKVLVQAWMDSPGHRANILSFQYQEIGVSVLKCIFEGNTTWLAVQHFGLPLSACSQPSKTFAGEIEANQNQIKELQNILEALQSEIRTMRPKRGTAYLQKIEQYNNLVEQYNALINETEILINQYNDEVKMFNDCAAGLR